MPFGVPLCKPCFWWLSSLHKAEILKFMQNIGHTSCYFSCARAGFAQPGKEKADVLLSLAIWGVVTEKRRIFRAAHQEDKRQWTQATVMEIHIIYKETHFFHYVGSWVSVAQRDGAGSPSPWRVKIQLDTCHDSIQLWAGGWSEDLQGSLPI